MQIGSLLAAPLREELDGLRLAILDDFEVSGGEPVDDAPLLVGDGHPEVDEVGPGAECGSGLLGEGVAGRKGHD
jgi:hypothetical protein